MIEKWRVIYKDGDYIDVNKEFGLLTVEILSHSLFTQMNDDTSGINQLFNDVLVNLKKKFQTPEFLWRFSPNRKLYEKSVYDIKNVFRTIVMTRLNEINQWDDLIGFYSQEHKDFSREQLTDYVVAQVATFFGMGYLTIPSLMHWIAVTFSQQPETERRVSEEVHQVLGGRLPTFNDFGSLQYLSLVMKEILRLHPLSVAIMRESLADDMLGEYFLPKGAGVTISLHHVQRHPEFWKNPEGFDPERFRNNPLGQNNPFAYIPFGAGKRKCPAQAFSILEGTLMAAVLSQHIRLELPANSVVKPYFTTLISMRPSEKIMRLRFKN